MKNKGVIYILTNPSFPQYVKIGYADNMEERLKQLNRSECIPFAFRLYAYYAVSERLQDLKLHNMIDKLNPNLRAIDEFDGKKRVREFYEMSAEDAYAILETIAEINGLSQNLVRVKPSEIQIKDEEKASESIAINNNRHYFKELTFKSSLTGHLYHGDTNGEGNLRIFDKTDNREIENNESISKKRIVIQALLDADPCENASISLYQAYHRLCNILLNKNAVDINQVNDKKDNNENNCVRVHIRNEYCEAFGYYLGEKVVILKGSKIRSNVAPNYSKKRDRLLKSLIDDGVVVDFIFVKDSREMSLSAASSLVLGNSSNGWKDWKTDDGEPLKKYLDR